MTLRSKALQEIKKHIHLIEYVLLFYYCVTKYHRYSSLKQHTLIYLPVSIAQKFRNGLAGFSALRSHLAVSIKILAGVHSHFINEIDGGGGEALVFLCLEMLFHWIWFSGLIGIFFQIKVPILVRVLKRNTIGDDR